MQYEENEEHKNLVIQVEVGKATLQSDENMSQSLKEIMNNLLKNTNGHPRASSNEINAFVEVDNKGISLFLYKQYVTHSLYQVVCIRSQRLTKDPPYNITEPLKSRNLIGGWRICCVCFSFQILIT